MYEARTVSNRNLGGRKPADSPLASCVRAILRPVVRFCVNRSIKLNTLTDVAKELYVEEAARSLARTKSKSSNSRLSLMTGVHRKDVARLRDREDQSPNNCDIISRVVGHWQHSRKFQTVRGRPRTLSCEGNSSEFAQLVREVAREMNPYTVLFELERIGAVVRSNRGVRLEVRVFNPRGDVEGGFKLLSDDLNDLITAVSENVFDPAEEPNLHIKTEYDNIPASLVPKVRAWFLDEGSAFHQRARKYLAQLDRDFNKRSKAKGKPVRVALAAFSIVDDDPASITQRKTRKKRQ